MSVSMRGRSLSPTKVELVHETSGTTIATSAPVDNGGDGSGFSPTDLAAASLGACATTIMGMHAARAGVKLEVEFRVLKEMASGPRRLGRLTVEFTLRTDCDEETFDRIVQAGKTCPVRLSLAPGVEVVEDYRRG